MCSNWWNENWYRKPKYSEKTCPSATLSTINPIWPVLGSNPGGRNRKPETNRLSYGTTRFIDLELEYLCLLLSNEEERGQNRHLKLRSIPCSVLERIRCQHRTNSGQVRQLTIWWALHEQVLYPYHLQKVQDLKSADCPARKTLWQWFVQQCAEPPFLSSVSFSYAAGFGRDGIINLHNHHQWTEDNPYDILQSRHQQQFSINVLASTVDW
jgi:hypothetical protein